MAPGGRSVLCALVIVSMAVPALPAPVGDGHARPRGVAFNADDGLVYVALSTADEIAIVDPAGETPRILDRRHVCHFPDAVVALPGGGALVACRFDPGLRRVSRRGRSGWRVTTVDAGPDGGARGLVIAPGGTLAYLASPASAGVKAVSLAGAGVVQTVPTGLSPRALHVVPAGKLPGRAQAFLLVSTFIDHAVTVHPIGPDDRLGDPIQTIRSAAPVLDMLVTGEGSNVELLLFTHEDRELSRAHGPVEGLDSGVLRLRANAGTLGATPFQDPGAGRRAFINLAERKQPVIELARAAIGDAGFAVVGAGSDNLLVCSGADGLANGVAVEVGANPSAVAALPGGRFVTADRLSDTLTFVAGGRVTSSLALGPPERSTPAERGELLFFSRALVPNNLADGPLSLYTCAACHDDGHVDGRRHPAKRNRFYSMTKTCRGLGTTAPYLTLGDPATIEAFADNIVATHAQGVERDASGFDKYPVDLRVRGAGKETRVVLSPTEVRAALAAYMARIPPEPSPFVAPRRRALVAEERRGLGVFRTGCTGCHQLVGDSALGNRVPAAELERRLLAGAVALTSPRRYAVGTPILGEGGNNPPSLRGVWDAAPYFSDGSARTLEEVLRRTDPDAPTVHAPENAARPPAFSADVRAALLAFLRVL